jgi:hypothetical protein
MTRTLVACGPFVALFDLELDVLAFVEAAVAVGVDRGVVHEDVRAAPSPAMKPPPYPRSPVVPASALYGNTET